MIIILSKSGNVKVNDAIVGMIIHVPKQGYAFKHFKFGLKISSFLPTEEELMVRVSEYLQKSFA